MFELSTPFKIITLPISCDTLLLTFSPHHEVIHHHSYSFEQAIKITNRYQQTHRICILADSYLQGLNASKLIKESQDYQKMKQQNVDCLPTTILKLQNLSDKKENNSILTNVAGMFNKLHRQIDTLNTQIGKQKLEGQVSKSKSKTLKVKQKKLGQLQRSRQKLRKQCSDRIWLQKRKAKVKQDEYLLQQFDEYEQEESLDDEQT